MQKIVKVVDSGVEIVTRAALNAPDSFLIQISFKLVASLRIMVLNVNVDRTRVKICRITG